MTKLTTTTILTALLTLTACDDAPTCPEIEASSYEISDGSYCGIRGGADLIILGSSYYDFERDIRWSYTYRFWNGEFGVLAATDLQDPGSCGWYTCDLIEEPDPL